jgi:hypothetical protein
MSGTTPAAAPDRATVTAELATFTAGLDSTSRELARLARELEPLEATYASELETFVADLWTKYGTGEIRTWPGEETRVALFHAHLRESAGGLELLAKLTPLRARRKRLDDRLADVRSGVSARQSILKGLG